MGLFSKKKKQQETLFKAKDVAILRETLAHLHKKVPPILQKKVNHALLRFAQNVSEYCQHEESVWVENENAYACLNCGERQSKAEFEKGFKVIK